MKITKLTILGCMALGLLTACSSEEDFVKTDNTSADGKVYAMGYRATPPQSRTAYDDAYNQSSIMGVTWAEGDKFTVFKAKVNTPVTFTLEEGANTKSGKFSCSKTEFDNLSISDYDVLNAIYPELPAGETYNQKRIVLNLAEQTQAGITPDKLAKTDYMVGHAVYNASNATDTKVVMTFDFSDKPTANAGYVCSIMRFDVDFSGLTDRPTEVYSATFSIKNGDNDRLNTRALINLDSKSTFLYDTPSIVTVNITDGTIPDNGQFPIWMSLPPSDYSGTCTLAVKTDKGVYTFTKNVTETEGRVLDRGNRNWFAADMSGATPSPYTTYNALGEGTEVSPYLLTNETQLKDLAKAVNSEESRAASRSIAEGKHFKLVRNITLAGNWEPIGKSSAHPFNGTIDGNNKTISDLIVNATDQQYSGFIGYMKGGELKDITVKGSVTVSNTGIADTYAAGLVACNEGGTMSGALKSEVDVNVTINGDATSVKLYVGAAVGNGSATDNANSTGKVTVSAPSGTTISYNGQAVTLTHTITNVVISGSITGWNEEEEL